MQAPTQPNPFPRQEQIEAKRATIGFALSLAAGILILVQGVVRLVRADLIAQFGLDTLTRRIIGEVALTVLGAAAIAFGAIIIVGAYLIYRLGSETAGGVLVLVFSALSIITGGGFLIGMILGVVGAILGLLGK